MQKKGGGGNVIELSGFRDCLPRLSQTFIKI